ncbi:Uncharacterized protein SCF082_LOCUS13246 [Durusdinium trenchii]|uniref:BRCT domain-containing protein n=1 Tax=Durusdinium trenchii TaxID=1381693 RepID=A0ABP0JQ45_9DINO
MVVVGAVQVDAQEAADVKEERGKEVVAAGEDGEGFAGEELASVWTDMEKETKQARQTAAPGEGRAGESGDEEDGEEGKAKASAGAAAAQGKGTGTAASEDAFGTLGSAWDTLAKQTKSRQEKLKAQQHSKKRTDAMALQLTVAQILMVFKVMWPLLLERKWTYSRAVKGKSRFKYVVPGFPPELIPRIGTDAFYEDGVLEYAQRHYPELFLHALGEAQKQPGWQKSRPVEVEETDLVPGKKRYRGKRRGRKRPEDLSPAERKKRESFLAAKNALFDISQADGPVSMTTTKSGRKVKLRGWQGLQSATPTASSSSSSSSSPSSTLAANQEPSTSRIGMAVVADDDDHQQGQQEMEEEEMEEEEEEEEEEGNSDLSEDAEMVQGGRWRHRAPMASAQTDDGPDGDDVEEPLSFKDVYPWLQRTKKWTAARGSGLVYWYYMKPGVVMVKGRPRGTHMVDYFNDQDDVISYMKMNDDLRKEYLEFRRQTKAFMAPPAMVKQKKRAARVAAFEPSPVGKAAPPAGRAWNTFDNNGSTVGAMSLAAAAAVEKAQRLGLIGKETAEVASGLLPLSVGVPVYSGLDGLEADGQIMVGPSDSDDSDGEASLQPIRERRQGRRGRRLKTSRTLNPLHDNDSSSDGLSNDTGRYKGGRPGYGVDSVDVAKYGFEQGGDRGPRTKRKNDEQLLAAFKKKKGKELLATFDTVQLPVPETTEDAKTLEITRKLMKLNNDAIQSGRWNGKQSRESKKRKLEVERADRAKARKERLRAEGKLSEMEEDEDEDETEEPKSIVFPATDDGSRMVPLSRSEMEEQLFSNVKFLLLPGVPDLVRLDVMRHGGVCMENKFNFTEDYVLSVDDVQDLKKIGVHLVGFPCIIDSMLHFSILAAGMRVLHPEFVYNAIEYYEMPGNWKAFEIPTGRDLLNAKELFPYRFSGMGADSPTGPLPLAHRVFAGCSFFVLPDAGAKDLEALVTVGGGNVSEALLDETKWVVGNPDGLTPEGQRAFTAVVQANKEGIVVSAEFVLQCIVHGRVLDPDLMADGAGRIKLDKGDSNFGCDAAAYFGSDPKPEKLAAEAARPFSARPFLPSGLPLSQSQSLVTFPALRRGHIRIGLGCMVHLRRLDGTGGGAPRVAKLLKIKTKVSQGKPGSTWINCQMYKYIPNMSHMMPWQVVPIEEFIETSIDNVLRTLVLVPASECNRFVDPNGAAFPLQKVGRPPAWGNIFSRSFVNNSI